MLHNKLNPWGFGLQIKFNICRTNQLRKRLPGVQGKAEFHRVCEDHDELTNAKYHQALVSINAFGILQGSSQKQRTYLIQEYSLYYAPSLSVLNEMALRRRQQSTNDSLIAFGNPVIERNEKLKQGFHPLPEAEAEVAAVARAVRTQMKRVLVGREADEKTFKTVAPQYATIHLATHGVLDNKDPLNSHLLLTKTDGDLENDGLLQAREIIDMRLDIDLAVLSACETGNGRISQVKE